MKKLLTVFLLLPAILFAQNPKGTEYYSCCQDHSPCIQIYGSANLAAHNCREHKVGCPSTSTKYASPQSRKHAAIVLTLAALGAGGGYAYGNTVKDENGQTKALDYTLLGTASGAVVAAVGNKIFSKKTKGGYDAVRGKRRFFYNTALRFSGNRIGIIIML